MDKGQELGRGRYQIVEIIGQGALGSVYRAFDSRLGVDVAIKTLNDFASNSHEARMRNISERRIPSRMPHPGIVPILDSGVEGRRSWFAMELFSDGDLFEAVRAGTLDIDDNAILSIGAQLLGALNALFMGSGSVHRDVKPENIAIQVEDNLIHAVLIDFGAARDAKQRITKIGALLGTDDYRAPEFASTAVKSPEFWRNYDLWGLGATLYFALFGSAPYSSYRTYGERAEFFRTSAEIVPDGLCCGVKIHDLIWGLMRWNPKLREEAGEALLNCSV